MNPDISMETMRFARIQTKNLKYWWICAQNYNGVKNLLKWPCSVDFEAQWKGGRVAKERLWRHLDELSAFPYCSASLQLGKKECRGEARATDAIFASEHSNV